MKSSIVSNGCTLKIFVTLCESLYFLFLFIVVQLRSLLIGKPEGQGGLDLSISLMRVLLMPQFQRWTERFVREFSVNKLSKWQLLWQLINFLNGNYCVFDGLMLLFFF